MVCFLNLWKDQKLNSQVQLEFHENVIYVSPGKVTSPYYLVSTETKLNSSMEQRSCLVICQESLTCIMSKSWYMAQLFVVVIFCLLCTSRVRVWEKKLQKVDWHYSRFQFFFSSSTQRKHCLHPPTPNILPVNFVLIWSFKSSVYILLRINSMGDYGSVFPMLKNTDVVDL